MENIFVYGTLRSDDASGMHELMRNSFFAGEGHVKGRLLEGTQYPALTHDESHFVTGELYSVTAKLLRDLDDYEGEEYERRKAGVSLTNGNTQEAWVYYFKTTGVKQ